MTTNICLLNINRQVLRDTLLTLFLLCLMISINVEAAQKTPKSLTFSYIQLPSIINTHIPLIRETYARLGIEIKFVLQPSSRNLKLVDTGGVDGDVAFTKLLVANYENLFAIHPSVSQAQYVLLCRKSLVCDESVLADKNTIVVATDTTQKGLDHIYQDKIQVIFYSINRIDHIPNLIVQERFDYGVYAMDVNRTEGPFPEAINIYPLYTINIVHVLNKKFSFLKDRVSLSLKNVLAEKSRETATLP